MASPKPNVADTEKYVNVAMCNALSFCVCCNILAICIRAMNDTFNFTDSTTSIVPCPDCLCPSIYSELGVFISSILLSLGGIFSILLVWCRKSKCTSIDLCGLKIKRTHIAPPSQQSEVELGQVKLGSGK